MVEIEQEIENDQKQWSALPSSEKAYRMYDLMLDGSGKSGLKAIVAQCFAALIKMSISILPEDITELDMFDLDLYQYKINDTKKQTLKKKIINDPYLKYLVAAIEYSVSNGD